MNDVLMHTKLPFKTLSKGKVRDIYDLDDHLLLVVSDRVSAFDWVIPTPIPSKGACLTQLSKFWFEKMSDVVPNHMVSTEVSDFPEELHEYSDQLKNRSMLVKKAKVIPIECIVRGYISGSAWKSYQKDQTVCGIKLESGLKESEQFPEPLFTPSTKAEQGMHDENISYERMVGIVGVETAEALKTYSLDLYSKASAYARERGIIIADTKFEFGLIDGQIALIDECLTPDSSRFWPAELYEPGKGQPSFDKQYVRDYLSSTGWDKNSPAPALPDEVVSETQKKYREAYEIITGETFDF